MRNAYTFGNVSPPPDTELEDDGSGGGSDELDEDLLLLEPRLPPDTELEDDGSSELEELDDDGTAANWAWRWRAPLGPPSDPPETELDDDGSLELEELEDELDDPLATDTSSISVAD
jgi:hypothetical protein